MELNGIELKRGDVWQTRDGRYVILQQVEPRFEDDKHPISGYINIADGVAGLIWFNPDGSVCHSNAGEDNRWDLIKPAGKDVYLKFVKD